MKTLTRIVMIVAVAVSAFVAGQMYLLDMSDYLNRIYNSCNEMIKEKTHEIIRQLND